MVRAMSETTTSGPVTAGSEEHAAGRVTEIRRGIVTSEPVLLATIAYGLVFGAQASQRRLHFLEVPSMTSANFASGSEFAAIKLWAAPPKLLLIVVMTFLINSRQLIMGAALTPLSSAPAALEGARAAVLRVR
jgi:predicted branched-subunit amino acid permease